MKESHTAGTRSPNEETGLEVSELLLVDPHRDNDRIIRMATNLGRLS
jgi:hypothetical protein